MTTTDTPPEVQSVGLEALVASFLEARGVPRGRARIRRTPGLARRCDCERPLEFPDEYLAHVTRCLRCGRWMP